MPGLFAHRHVAWLAGVHSLPPLHIAALLELPIDFVTKAIEQPRPGWLKHPRKKRSRSTVQGKVGKRVLCLAELGYPAPRIAAVLCLYVHSVRSFLERRTARDGRRLAKPRTKREAANQARRQRRRAARIARKAAAWPWPCPADPAAELVDHVPAGQAVAGELLELPPSAPLPIEPNRWDDTGDLRHRLDPLPVPPPATPKLKPPATPKPKRKPRERRHHWHVRGDRRITDPD